jgi:hypothetical protein
VSRLDRAVALCLLAVFAGMSIVAVGYQYEARLMPLVVGLPAIALTIAQLVKRPLAAAPVHESMVSRAELVALAWLAAFAALIALGGVVVGGAIAVMLTQRAWLRERWPTALLGGALSAALLLVVFERQLGIALFQGLLVERFR